MTATTLPVAGAAAAPAPAAAPAHTAGGHAAPPDALATRLAEWRRDRTTFVVVDGRLRLAAGGYCLAVRDGGTAPAAPWTGGAFDVRVSQPGPHSSH